MPPDDLRASGQRPGVLVVGDANPDLVLRGDVVPRFGQAEQLLDDASLVVGGSAAITAHGLARLGRPVALVAAVGDDTFGERLRGQLTGAGVDVSRVVVRPDLPTGLTVVLSRGEDRAMLTHAGAIGSLTAPEVLAAVDHLRRRGVTHLHLSSLYLQPGLAGGLPDVLRAVHEAGLTTSLDTNDDPTGRWAGVDALLAHVDVLLPNRAEAIALGRESDAHRAAAALAARGPLVVVKDGADGAFAVGAGGEVVEVAATAQQPLDTTGAGDTFDAAFLDAWLDDAPLHLALRRAVVAGSLSVGVTGGTAGQPTREQLDRALCDPASQSGDPS